VNPNQTQSSKPEGKSFDAEAFDFSRVKQSTRL
jgi:hypothetical protein